MEGIAEGDVWWADLAPPVGSGPGFRRPVVVVQADWVTRSGIATVLCVPLTTNLHLGDAPGTVPLSAARSGLKKDSVAVVSSVVAVDRGLFEARAGRLPRGDLRRIVAGIDLLLAD